MAVIRFHSKAGGDFFYLEDVRDRLFKAAGLPCSAQGAISPEEALVWLERLEAALEVERKREMREDAEVREKAVGVFRKPGLHPASAFDEEEKAVEEASRRIPLSARAAPLLWMLKRAAAEGEMIMWGVP